MGRGGAASEPPASHPWSCSPVPQVWFKNRRAKRSRLERLAKGQGQGAPDAPTDPGAPGPAPAPAPVVVAAAAAAAAAARPAFPEDPGFWRPPPPSPAGMLPAPEPSVSSGGPALWGAAQGARAEVLAVPAPVPAPAPGWPQDPYDPTFCPGSCPVPDFTKIFSRQDPSQEGPPPLMSGHQNRDDSLDENDLGPGFMNL